MSAAGVDLAPLVEACGGRGEHDQEFLLQAQAAHSRAGVVAAGSGEDLPLDGVGVVHVLEFPDVRREPGAWLVAVAAVALMLADPVPHGAVCQAGVRLLHPSGEVGDLCPIHHSFGHAVAWKWAFLASSVPIAPSARLLLLVPHLDVFKKSGSNSIFLTYRVTVVLCLRFFLLGGA